MSSTQVLGAAAEARAAELLVAHGLRVIERNFRVRGGELDLICLEGDAVVFVEVRWRRNLNFGGAAASITPRKMSRLALAAQYWLARHPQFRHAPCRFDCVLSNGTGEELTVEWLRDAFTLTPG